MDTISHGMWKNELGAAEERRSTVGRVKKDRNASRRGIEDKEGRARPVRTERGALEVEHSSSLP